MDIEMIKKEALRLYSVYGTLDAVKYIKTETGFGLKESKDLIDKWTSEPFQDDSLALNEKVKVLTEALQQIIFEIESVDRLYTNVETRVHSTAKSALKQTGNNITQP